MITETYRDIEIVLLEDENKWRFTANGRERTAPTLPKAREYIDNALDKEVKEKPWKPFEAWYTGRFGGDGTFIKVRVTSEAERGRYGSSDREFWITYTKEGRRGDESQQREKVSRRYLYAVTPENDDLIQRITTLAEQQSALDAQEKELREKLKTITAPVE